MPTKMIRIERETAAQRRPVVLAIAGDSASGKTTLARRLAEVVGEDRCTWICTDDYHRFDRAELSEQTFTVLDPRANHVEIMEQHLQLLALGRPVLKPVYDHATGRLTRPQLVVPGDVVIVEGLLPMSTRIARACFDAMIYLDPEESLRRSWKVRRDTTQRGYTEEQVLAQMDRSRGDAERYVKPQRREADLVVRFLQEGSVEVLLRPTLRQPPLADAFGGDPDEPVSVTIVRDEGTPTDLLRVAAEAPYDERVLKEILDVVPPGLGEIDGRTSIPLAVAQALLLHHALVSLRGR